MEGSVRDDVSDALLLSVVVPCFNEAVVIRLTHERLIAVLGSSPDFDLEIIYVNDGSNDGTEEILFGLAEKDDRAGVVSFSRNFGHQPAVSAGLKYARGDVVAVIDADLQDPPEVILDMLAKWREGYEVVYGVRAKRKENRSKKFAYAAFYRLLRLLADVDLPLHSGDFSLMDRQVVDVLNALPEKNRFVRGLRAWSGFRQTGILYERPARVAGESKYSFSKLLRLAFDGIFNFSTAPLTLIFFAGVFTAFLSLLGSIFFALHRLLGFKIFGYSPEDVPGFTSIILALLFFSGVQLISLGTIGEYLGRIYQEVKMRPAFVVKCVRGRVVSNRSQTGGKEE